MTIGDGLYAHLETDFPRGNRFHQASAGARVLYYSLWCYALEQRREIIERPTNDYLASIAGLHHHPITSYLQRLHVLKLLIVNDEYIAVIGLRKKHKKINFKPEFQNSGIEFQISGSPPFLSYPSLSIPVLSFPPIPPKGEIDESPKPKSKPDKKILDPEKFDLFWKHYPRKLNKAGAIKKWNATLTAEEADGDQLAAAAENYAATCNGKAEKYILHPATFLGPDRRWKDFLEPVKPTRDNRGGRPDDDYDALMKPGGDYE